MPPFLSRFHIRDLEKFSGVKAHTIRVWERRYGLLAPDRTATNIRTYSIDELKTILNVSYLNQHAHKISRIAAMSPAQREKLVRETVLDERSPDGILNSMILATLSFDGSMFERLCADHERDHGFRSLVEGVFIALLQRIGILWQSSAICPAHEHFVSNLIRQRLVVATAQQPTPNGSGALHVLYLPEDEIHELGLLYLNYLLRSLSRRTLYLGQSVPRADLAQVAHVHSGELVFISVFVVQPAPDRVQDYINTVRMELPEQRCSFLFVGNALRQVAAENIPYGMRLEPELLGSVGVVVNT